MNTSDEEYDIEDTLEQTEKTHEDVQDDFQDQDRIQEEMQDTTTETTFVESDSETEESYKPFNDIYTQYMSWKSFITMEVSLVLNEIRVETNIPLFMFLNGVACGGLFGPNMSAFACIIGICILADIYEIGKSRISFVLWSRHFKA